MWQIQDDNGVIHSGTQEKMEHIFDVMSDPDNWSDSVIARYGLYHFTGDLQLVHVVRVFR